MNNFIHPCPEAKLTSKFGYRTIYGKKEWHQGVDFAKSGVVHIHASCDGVVRDVWGETKSSYGNVIFIQHIVDGKRMDSVYAHLKTIMVKKGQNVKQGDVIGIMGNTGRSTGQHLHFEIHNGAWATGQPNAVDPMKYIEKVVKPTGISKSLQSGSYSSIDTAQKVIVYIRKTYGLSEKYNYAYQDGDVYRWRTGSMDSSQAEIIKKDIIDKGYAKIVNLV